MAKTRKEPNNDLIPYLEGILKLQFDVLSVNEARGSSIIAINGALFAGIVFVIQTFNYKTKSILIFLILSIIFCLISLVFSLLFVFPRINARIGNEKNIRGTIGICKLTKHQYLQKIRGLDSEEMVKQLSYQISGMARNNKKGAIYLRISIVFSIMAFVLFSISLVCATLFTCF